MGLWWLVFPCFTALTCRLAFERVCGDPYDLLPTLTSEPGWAWPLACVYMLAHLWVVTAYLQTVSRTQALVPTISAFGVAWGAHATKIVLLLGVMLIEYLPISLWRLIGASVRCAQ